MHGGRQIELKDICKRFQAVEALTDINLKLERGKVHAFVGENGAGKSTLGKIISGEIRPDIGELIVDGEPTQFYSPRDAIKLGITAISQEITVVPQLSVMNNVFLGIETENNGFFIQNDRLRQRFYQLVERSGFGLPADVLVGSLRVADQKKVEILRALAQDARLIVMDEPTASMAADEAEILLNIVRNLAATGTTVVYISHFLKEVLNLADTVTVLRNGRLIRTALSIKESPESLVTAMLGREMITTFPPKDPPSPDSSVVLSVVGLTQKRLLKQVSFNIRAGEIVGLAGLVGSGRSEVARAIFGAESRESGVIMMDGRKVEVYSTHTAVKVGMALLPESRKLQGLIMCLSVANNISLPHLDAISHGPFVRTRYEHEQTKEMLEKLDIRPADPQEGVTKLSGGNQQKTLFAKWLFRRPRVLIADEPTRGVDIGAKQAIYQLEV